MLNKKNNKQLSFKKKALSPIISTILLVTISVILIVSVLSFGKGFTNDKLENTKDTQKLTKSDIEHFISSKSFHSGNFVFNYAPPSNGLKEIKIVKYKIIYDFNETEEIELEDVYIKPGSNVLNLDEFNDFNIPSNKITIILETDNKLYITLKDIENSNPYVRPLSSENYILSFQVLDYNLDINNDNNSISLELNESVDFLNNLIPVISISEKATISPSSNTSQNFTTPIEYTVTAENGSIRTYLVIITVKKQQYIVTGSPGNVNNVLRPGLSWGQLWKDLNNIKNTDGYFAHTAVISCADFGVYDENINLILNNNTIGMDNKANKGDLWKLSGSDFENTTYGNYDDLWSENLTPIIINNSEFGIALQVKFLSEAGDVFSYDLQATNFNFDIPLTAIIKGVAVNIVKRFNITPSGPPCFNIQARVDSISMTVYYEN